MDALSSEMTSIVVAVVGGLATVLAAVLPARIGSLERRLENVERAIAEQDDE